MINATTGTTETTTKASGIIPADTAPTPPLMALANLVAKTMLDATSSVTLTMIQAAHTNSNLGNDH